MQDRPTAAQLATSAKQYLRTGKWDVSFIKENSEADAPAFASSGRRTERLDSIPSISAIDTPNPANAHSEPAASKPIPQKPTAGSATRADFSPTEEKKKSKMPLVIGLVVILLVVAGVGGYFFMEQQKAALLKAQYDQSMSSANSALAGDKFADAKTAYLAALEVYPDDATAKSGLQSVEDKIKVKYDDALNEGNTLLEGKKYTEAIEKFNLALTFNPEGKDAKDKIALANYNIELEKGDTYLVAKDFVNAKNAYEKALGFKAGDELAQGKFDEANRQEKAIRLAKVNADLIAGVKSGSSSQVKDALAAGADATAHDGKTPILLIAIKAGNLQMVKDLVAAGAKCNDRSGSLVVSSTSYATPAVLAAGTNKMDILKYLIESCKASVNDQEYNAPTSSYNGWSPLGAAASAGNLEAVKYLVSKGADKNVKQGSAGYTPLLEASENGHYEVVKFLIDNKADIMVTTKNGKDAYELTKSSTIKSLLKENGLGKLTIIDNFNSYSSSVFFPDQEKYTDSNRDVYIAGGKLVFFLKKDVGSSYTEDINDVDANQDYTVEADFSQTGTQDPHGLVFGGKGSGDSYRVLIDPNGGYVALKKYANGDWKTIVDYKQTSAVNQRSGSTNTIKIEKKGSSVDVYVNGTKIISNQSLPRLFGNTFGFFCQTVETKLTVDNFKIVGGRK
jgi:ankyrin repeat protein